MIMPAVLPDVLRDLLANARKYTAPGGRSSAGLVHRGAEIRLVVEDEGIGVPADELERVVAYGYRASAAEVYPTKGAGFGLTRAYDVTPQLNGRFVLESELGRGTRVAITVPIPPEYQTKPAAVAAV